MNQAEDLCYAQARLEIAKEMGEKSMKEKYEQQAALGNGAAAGDKALAAKYVSLGTQGSAWHGDPVCA